MIDFNLRDLDSYDYEDILNSNNKEIIRLVFSNISTQNLIDILTDDIDEINEDTMVYIEENVISKIENVDTIEKILKSDLIKWSGYERSPFNTGFFSPDIIDSESSLSKETITKLMTIYMKEHKWKHDFEECWYEDLDSYLNECDDLHHGCQMKDTFLNSKISNDVLNSTINDNFEYIKELGYDTSNINSNTSYNDLGISYIDLYKIWWHYIFTY